MFLKKIFYTLVALLSTANTGFASLTGGGNSPAPKPERQVSQNSGGWSENMGAKFDAFGEIALKIATVIALYFFFLWLIRVIFEFYYSKNLVHLKVSVPKSDSKLDKEKETKKDFKEKIGMMNMFYKAIHKLDEAGMKDTILNFFFRHSKVSLEIIYHE